jgi:hypothetical protein
VSGGEPVVHRPGHRVRLVPHDGVPRNPAVRLERERHPPGQFPEIFLRRHQEIPAEHKHRLMLD